jgi:hypothetical protein
MTPKEILETAIALMKDIQQAPNMPGAYTMRSTRSARELHDLLTHLETIDAERDDELLQEQVIPQAHFNPPLFGARKQNPGGTK